MNNTPKLIESILNLPFLGRSIKDYLPLLIKLGLLLGLVFGVLILIMLF